MNEGHDTAASEIPLVAGNLNAFLPEPLANVEHSATESAINGIAGVTVENIQQGVVNNGSEDVVNGAVDGAGVVPAGDVSGVPVNNASLAIDAVPLLKSLFGIS